MESVKFAKVGIDFKVTPFISPGGTIMLDIVTEFSSLRGIRDGIPVVDRRNAQSVVQARNNETVLLGGLINEECSDQKAGIPGLRSIPHLGMLFGAKRNRMLERELIIVITPRIVNTRVLGTIESAKSAFPRLQECSVGTLPVLGNPPELRQSVAELPEAPPATPVRKGKKKTQ